MDIQKLIRDNSERFDDLWRNPEEIEGYSVTLADSYGGEGQGDEYWKVFKIEKEGVDPQFWRVTGWYASHHGAEVDWDCAARVEAYEKTVTDWKAYGSKDPS